MKSLIALLALIPAIAFATPAQLDLSWEGEGDEHRVYCGFEADALDPVGSTPGTEMTVDLTLPGDSGTLYCAVESVRFADDSELVSDLTLAAYAEWAITHPPEAPTNVIIIEVRITCPEGAQCDVSVSRD